MIRNVHSWSFANVHEWLRKMVRVLGSEGYIRLISKTKYRPKTKNDTNGKMSGEFFELFKYQLATGWLKLLIKWVAPGPVSAVIVVSSVVSSTIVCSHHAERRPLIDVYKYALPSLFLFHFVTKLSPSITRTVVRRGEGKH